MRQLAKTNTKELLKALYIMTADHKERFYLNNS